MKVTKLIVSIILLITASFSYAQEQENDSKIEKEEMIRKLETLPTMNGFYPGNTELKFPKSETTISY